MLQTRSAIPLRQQHGALSYSFARTDSEIQEAQRLRYKVFAEEMGTELADNNGLDIDGFDAYCDHL